MTLPASFIVFDTFAISDPLGKLIVLGLLVVSVWVWSIIFVKYREVFRMHRADAVFQRAFKAQNHPLEIFVSRASPAGNPDSDLASVYEAACEAALREFNAMADRRGDTALSIDLEHERLTPLQLEAVRNAAESRMAQRVILHESSMIILNAAYSIAPLIGLFGTVWGVMLTFMSMGRNGAADLAAVAPGISSAMLTTIVGLVVAIPTSFCANHIADMLREATVDMNSFTEDMLAAFRQRFGVLS
ncbi:MAG: MotA/TolQ/ExbB proton channel family protein [Kiritimatiellae bacterium]|nr:MotA/TolQ/ExbB proton channel family protein [Kiritimatiellia bacterium]